MMYFVEFKDRNTDQKYVEAMGSVPYDAYDVIESIDGALKLARHFRSKYEKHYNANFEDSWSDARKANFRKLNAWSVRVQDDDGKTILLITDKMFF